MTAGYDYNITFVQLGLIDLGTRHVGLTGAGVSTWMAVLALTTFAVAVATGYTMDRRGWSRDLHTKLRLLFGVVTAQLLLTAVAPFVRAEPAFGAWILLASASMGVGFPVTFATTVDFVPVRDRGYVAAAATALTYFLANAVVIEWRIETFAAIMVAAMLPGLVVVGALAFREFAFVEKLATQHESFGRGRFCRPDPVGTWTLAFWLPVVLMFGVFFVDSLGFLRIVDTPSLVLSSWQSPEIGTRLGIGVVHVVAAAVAGIAAFVAAMAVLGRIPVVGAVVQLALVLTGVGAVLITYFGLREFQPPELPE